MKKREKFFIVFLYQLLLLQQYAVQYIDDNIKLG